MGSLYSVLTTTEREQSFNLITSNAKFVHIINYVKIRIFVPKRMIRLIRTEQLWLSHTRHGKASNDKASTAGLKSIRWDSSSQRRSWSRCEMWLLVTHYSSTDGNYYLHCPELRLKYCSFTFSSVACV